MPRSFKVIGYLARVEGLAAELGDSRHRVGSRSSTTGEGLDGCESCEQGVVAVLVDQGHQALVDGECAEHLLGNLKFEIDQGITDAVHVIAGHVTPKD